MNIGVFFKHRETGGGIYQYFLSLLEALARPNREDPVYVFYRWAMPSLPESQSSFITPVKIVPHTDSSRDLLSGPSSRSHEIAWNGKIVRFKTQSLTHELVSEAVKNRIELMLYPTPEREAFESGIPYVMAVHDVAHRLLPHFPEFTGNGILNQREYVYTEGIQNAFVVLVDSETGKKQVRTCYRAAFEKVFVLPFVPPSYILEEPRKEREYEWERRKQDLPSNYLFYPAQLWPHKNHAALITALGLLKKAYHTEVPAVFTGAEDDAENIERLRKLARELGVLNQITWLGYLDSHLMRFFYGAAFAMVMPTFLGPTNFPIVEAFAAGCPVIASNVPGAYELAGDAAILIDPENPEEIVSSILRLMKDASLRETLRSRGRRRIADRTAEAFSSRLFTVIDTFRAVSHDQAVNHRDGRACEGNR